MQNHNLKKLVQVGVMVAVEVVLSRFLSISTPTLKIGFGFVPVAVVAMMYGPLWAGAGAALADFIGAVLFPTAGYFPGFTLTAALTGVVFGLFLWQRPTAPPQRVGIARILIACAIVCFGLNFGLDTLWLRIITGTDYLLLLPTRVLKPVIMFPIEVLLVWLVDTRASLLYRFRA